MADKDFTFHEFRKHARSRLAGRQYFSHSYSPVKYAMRSDNTFLYIDHQDVNNESEYVLPVKCHFNFGSRNSIPSGWDTIIPIILRYPTLTKMVKIIDPEGSFDDTENNIRILRNLIDQKEKSIADPEERAFVIADLERAIEFFKEESRRLFESASATFYLYRDKKTGQLDIAALKKMLAEMEKELIKKEFKAGSTPPSDFTINPFASVRGDKDVHDNYVDIPRIYMPQNWEHFKENPTIQALADEKSLAAPCRETFQSAPIVVSLLSMKHEARADKVIDQVKKIMELFEKTPELNAALPQEAQDASNKMKKISKFKSLTTMEKFAGIIGAGEEGAARLYQWNPLNRTVFHIQHGGGCFDFFRRRPAVRKDIVLEELLKNFFDQLASYEQTGAAQLENQLKEIFKDLKDVCDQIKKDRTRKHKLQETVSESSIKLDVK